MPSLVLGGNFNLKDVFNEIAPSWYNFRHWSRFCPELEALANRWQPGRLINIGCAHGPDFLPFKEGFDLYGVDFSAEMLKFARKYAQKFSFRVNLTLSDVTELPYTSQTFDWAISIATYHHLRDDSARKSALSELERVLKPGGEAFITVWNRWHRRFWFKDKEVMMPWQMKGKTLYRYYYLFSYLELRRLVKRAGFEVLKFFPEDRFPLRFFSPNVCLLVRKKVRTS